jgi:hypothetical protein
MQCAWALIYCHPCPVPHYLIFYFLWRRCPTQGMTSSTLRSLDHTQRHTIFGTSPLDEWSARRRDLYLTIHNTQKRQTSMTTVGFKPTISVGERPQIHGLYRAASGSSYYLTDGTILGINVTEYIMCVLIVSTTLSDTFLNLRRIQRHIVINLDWSSRKYPLFLSDFNKTFRQIFQKSGNISVHRYPSSGSRVVPCGDRQTEGRTDMTKLTIAFRNFANKHKTASQTCSTLNLRTFGTSYNVEWQ